MRAYHNNQFSNRFRDHETLPPSINALKTIFSPLMNHKIRVFLAVLTLFLTAFIVLSLGGSIQNLIDFGFMTQSQKQLDMSFIIILSLAFLLSLCSYARSYLISWLGETTIGTLRRKVFEHLLDLDMDYYENHRPGEIISRLLTDTNLIQTLLGASFSLAMRNLLLMIGGLLMMFFTSFKLALYTLLIVPFLMIPLIAYGRRVRYYAQENQHRISQLSGYFEEIFHYIKTIQTLSREEVEKAHYKKVATENRKIVVKRILSRASLICFVMLLSFCGLGFVLWCGGQDVIHGVMTAGELSAFVYYAIIVATSSSSFSDLMSDLQRASAATHRLLMILSLPKMATGSRTLSSPTGIVAVHNISFSYPSNPEKLILEDFTLSLAPGENVALAGLTGAGKSTVFSLLLGFYKPQKGSIYIDGIDLNDLNIRDTRKHIALVSHDVALFSTSLYENLLIANPKATQQEITQAIELACLDDVIRNMPKGIHTPIGTKGARLSGGQKQRLSIARAILRNPKILLLDEATSALDSEMENQLQQNLYQFMKERTSLVIAHHFSTLIRAHRIVVLDQGKIQEVGTHAELMDKNGLYRKLALLQYYDKIDTMKYRCD